MSCQLNFIFICEEKTHQTHTHKASLKLEQAVEKYFALLLILAKFN